jgi:hypothetical protein
MSDIVERLRELVVRECELACECDCPPEATANYRYAMTCAEAADTIDALRAENEKLRAALSKISEYEIEEGCPCNACQHSAIARAALEGPQDRMAKPLEKKLEEKNDRVG